MRNFFSQIFQDVDGGYSAKRTAFFLFIAAFLLLIGGVALHQVPDGALEFVKGAIEKLQDLIKWMGALIASEQLTKFAPAKKDGP